MGQVFVQFPLEAGNLYIEQCRQTFVFPFEAPDAGIGKATQFARPLQMQGTVLMQYFEWIDTPCSISTLLVIDHKCGKVRAEALGLRMRGLRIGP